MSQSYPTIGSVESNSNFVSPNARIEVIASGFTWCEGPVWVGDQASGHLLFSDIPRNSIYRWSPSDGTTLFMQPSGYTGVEHYGLEPGSNGLAIDAEGRLTMCEHGDRRISRLLSGGGKQTIVDSYKGRRLNSPNDLVIARDGTVYFTDPIYGLPDRENDARRELDFCGVFRLTSSGELSLISKDLQRPNGIGLSTDQKTLIVSQSNPDSADWTLFDIGESNNLGEVAGIKLANASDQMRLYPGLPDGLCVSNDDIIYATGPGGVYVMNFDGERLGRFLTRKKTSNCTLSPDQRTLYVTADDVVCRIKL